MKAADPKPGFCPFCSCVGFEICDHFVGYARKGLVVVSGRRGYRMEKLGPKDATVDTGITVRVYREVGFQRGG